MIAPGTPLPWVAVTHHRLGHDRMVPVWYIQATTSKDNTVGVAVQAAFSADEEQLDGAYIVHACNLHPELVEALAELIAHKDRPPNHAHPDGALGEIEMWRKARAALARAGAA